MLPPFINQLIDDIAKTVGLIESTINPNGELELLVANTAYLVQCSLCATTADSVCVSRCTSFYTKKALKEFIRGSIHVFKQIMKICLDQTDNPDCSFKIKPCMEGLEGLLLKQCSSL